MLTMARTAICTSRQLSPKRVFIAHTGLSSRQCKSVQHDAAIIAVSALQLALEALAIVLLYGEDATDWFDARR